MIARAGTLQEPAAGREGGGRQYQDEAEQDACQGKELGAAVRSRPLAVGRGRWRMAPFLCDLLGGSGPVSKSKPGQTTTLGVACTDLPPACLATLGTMKV